MENFFNKINKKLEGTNLYLIVIGALIVLAILVSIIIALVSKKTDTLGQGVLVGDNKVLINDIRSGEIEVPLRDYPFSKIYREDFAEDENGRIVYNKDYSFGIDVSVHQGDIDWQKVKADGVEFAIIRVGFSGASRGGLWDDDKFEQNIKGAIENDIKVGVYFFSQAITEDEAEDEAVYVLSKIRKYKDKIDLPVVYDWEYVDIKDNRTSEITGDQITKFASAFCSKIRQAGYQPMFYTNKYLGYNEINLSELKEYPLWIAEYEKAPSFYYQYVMWQYTDSGKVDGINGDVDLDIAFTKFK